MYTIYANDVKIHSPALFERGYIVYGGTLKRALNSHGSFEFTLLPSHPYYDDVKKLSTYIYIYDDDDNGEVFRGRVISDKTDFQQRKKVYCEGELAFFCDTILRPFGFKGSVSAFVTKIITNHNAQVPAAKQFTVGQITVTDNNDFIVRSSETPITSWECISTRMIKLLGGYVRIRFENGVRYFDYLSDYTTTATQEIVFGENLIDLNDASNAEDLFTCLIPYGAQIKEGESGYVEQPENGEYTGNRVTISSVNSGKDYIKNTAAVALLGEVWCAATWDDVTLPSNLLTKATAYLNNNIYEKLTITATAFDLNLVDSSIDSIHIGDYVKVKSPQNNIDITLQCTSKTDSILSPDKCSVTLGIPETKLTEFTAEYIKR